MAKELLNNQIDRANMVLLDLKPNVTTTDREVAQQELNLSEPTVHRYLNGDGKKLDTALSLIRFLKGRIQMRDRELAV